MNKIYKVVWSKVKNCYVVASELAKRCTKGSGARGLRRTAVTLGVTAALVGGISGSAWAGGDAYISRDGNYTITGQGNVNVSTLSQDPKHIYISVTLSYTLTNDGQLMTGTAVTSALTDYVKTNALAAGNGLALSGTTYSLSAADNGGIAVDANGVAVKVESNKGLTVGANGVAVQLATDKGLTVDTNGIAVKAGNGITVDGNGVSVNANGTIANNNTGILTGGTVYTALTNNSIGIKASSLDAGSGAITTTGSITGGTITATTLKIGETDVNNIFAKIDGSNLGSINAATWATALGTGTIAENDNLLVKGSTVYAVTNELSSRIGTVDADKNYIKASTSKNVSENLILLDTQVKTNATAIAEKANKDGSNVTTPATWATNLGTGVIAASGDHAGELVKGSTVYTALQNYATKDSATLTNVSISSGNIADGVMVGTGASAPTLGSIATEAGKVADIKTKTDKITIDEGTATFTGNVIGNVTGNITGDVTGDLTGNVTATTLKVGSETSQKDVTTALTTVGEVVSSNAGFVTGDKVYNAVNAVDKALGKVAEGSNYLTVYDATTSTGTFAYNLIELDKAIGKTSKGNYIEATDATAANSLAVQVQALDTAAGTFRDKTQNITAVENITTMNDVLNVSDPTSGTTGVAISGSAKTITAGGIAIDGANNTLKVGGDTGITLSNATSGSTVTNTLKVGGVTISDNGTAKTITGLSNTTWDASAITSGQAATEDQLKSAITSISGTLTDTGLKFTANSGDPVTNKLGSTVSVVGSAKQDGHTYSASNVTTEIIQESGNSTITVMLNDNPTFASVTATGKMQGGSLTDGTATLTGGSLTGVKDFAASGTVTLGSGTNTVTVTSGAVTAAGNISGADIAASGMLSSATLEVGGVDVTTALTTAGEVSTSNAGFVTGGTVYSEVRPSTDRNYVKTANTTAANLTALDTAIGSVAADGNYIKASATNNVAQNLTALDTQVKTNADNIAALQSSTTAAVGTIDADGNYIKKSDTNNVSQNLIALDTQMKTNADNIAANKAAIGTTADGSYVKAAATVGRNLNALDTQVKTNTDDIATLKNSISVQEDASGTKTTTIDGNLVIKEDDGTTKDVTAALTTEGEVVKQGETGSEGFLKGETVYDYLNKGKDGDGKVRLANESKQISVGQGSEASGSESIAIGNETGGQKNEATGLQSIAIGFGNKVTGAHSGAIGDPGTLDADNSYMIGNNNEITESGTASFVLGNGNTVSGANSYAIGSGNNISGSNTFVMGHNVNASVDNAVVLGVGSTAEANAVSVGSDENKRQIKHVAPGKDADDAVTVGQVAALAQNTTTVINQVDSKLNKVGAGAAALAALHPIDTDDKFTMGIGYGNYRSAHSAAIGMFYRPTDKIMLSVGGAMGNGENMINAGISFALDKGKGFGTSKAAMARKIAAQDEEIKSLKEENAKLEARLAAIEAKLSK